MCATDPRGSNVTTQTATRVLLMVSHNNPLFAESWSSTEELIPKALDTLKERHLIYHQGYTKVPWTILVKKNMGIRVFVVFDIFNKDYDSAKGHLPSHNNLPVVVIHFSRKGVHTRIAESGLRQRVNNETAEAHNLNGWDAGPPYVVDHTTTVPIHMNPRDISVPKPGE